jgi:phospholipid-translocating ATPase
MGIQFDKDVSSATSQAFPQLYQRGIKGIEYSRPVFFGFMLDGLYQSIVCFFIPYLVYAYSPTNSVHGYNFSVWEFGTTVAVCAVTVANLFVGMHIRYWTWIVFVVVIGSTLAIHVWILIYSQFPVFFFQNEFVCESALLRRVAPY